MNSKKSVKEAESILEQKKGHKIRRGDIIRLNLLNTGGHHTEIKDRPYLVIQNNAGNMHSSSTIVCPLTTKIHKKHMPTHQLVSCKGIRPSIVLCENIHTVETDDSWEVIAHLPKEQMDDVELSLKISLGLM